MPKLYLPANFFVYCTLISLPKSSAPLLLSSVILIHDIVEIDAGDMFAFNHQTDHDAQAEKEVAAAKRV